jgi:hypothetical protein
VLTPEERQTSLRVRLRIEAVEVSDIAFRAVRHLIG